MTAIEAAHHEAQGQGQFEVRGRSILYRSTDGLTFRWSARTEKDARDQLRIFRAAPRYVGG